MNKNNILFTTFLAVFASTVSIAQTIPNNGFENWTMAGPSESADGWAGTPGIAKSTDNHSGSFAIEIKAGIFTNPMTMAADTLPGIANTGSQGMGPGTGTRGFAFAARPDSLVGWYKYTAMGNDAPVFNVILTKWNTTTSTSDIISNTMFMGSGQTTYTRFSFPIDYLSTLVPDSANIELLSSNSQPMQPILGSTLLVDDLSFVYNNPTGIYSIDKEGTSVAMYPNPTHDKLFVKYENATQSIQTVKITDALGRALLVLTEPALEKGIDVSQFSKGMYCIQFTDNNNQHITSKTFLKD